MSQVPSLNLLPRKSRRRLPRLGGAELVVAAVAIVVWVVVGYGIAVAIGLASLPLGP